jgi:hypothetical protein
MSGVGWYPHDRFVPDGGDDREPEPPEPKFRPGCEFCGGEGCLECDEETEWK